MKSFDKVAEETTRTSQRMDAMEGSVHRVAGALETFLGRIQIDDRLRLVPDTMRLTPAPHPSQSVSPGTPLVLPTIRSVSPSTPLELPMDEDEDDVAVGSSSVQDTRTTPSDVDTDIRMADVAIPTGSAHSPVGALAPERAPPILLAAAVPPPTPTVVPAPTFQVIPATPQGSRDVAIANPTPALPLPIPPTTVMEVDPIPPPPHARNRSRPPPGGHLVVEARTTRSRSRSKTPI